MHGVRGCAQQVISAHILGDDADLRDALIEEYVETCGWELLNCVFDFVYTHVVAAVDQDVNEEGATGSFRFMLTGLGTIIEECAQESGVPAHEIALGLSTARVDEANADHTALRAAQTCLIVHMLVREGSPPWGVQQNLDIEDMCVVVRALGDLMWSLLNLVRDVLGERFLIEQLLTGVHSILMALADAHETSLADLLSSYWREIALEDCLE